MMIRAKSPHQQFTVGAATSEAKDAEYAQQLRAAQAAKATAQQVKADRLQEQVAVAGGELGRGLTSVLRESGVKDVNPLAKVYGKNQPFALDFYFDEHGAFDHILPTPFLTAVPRRLGPEIRTGADLRTLLRGVLQKIIESPDAINLEMFGNRFGGGAPPDTSLLSDAGLVEKALHVAKARREAAELKESTRVAQSAQAVTELVQGINDQLVEARRTLTTLANSDVAKALLAAMDKKFGSRVLWQKALGNEPFGLHVSRTGQDVYLTRPGKLQVSAAASSLARGVFVDPTDVQALMMTNPEKVAEIRKVMQEQLDGWEQKGDLWDRPGIGSSGIGATVTEHAKATKRGYGFEL